MTLWHTITDVSPTGMAYLALFAAWALGAIGVGITMILSGREH